MTEDWTLYGPGAYVVKISATTPHGRRKLQTFVTYPDESTEWYKADLPSPAERRATRKYRLEHPGKPVARERKNLMPLAEDEFQSSVWIKDGFCPPSVVMVVILRAARSDGRVELDIEDVNAVVSERSSAIKKLDQLSEPDRRLAEKALYSLILARCTKV